MGKEKKLCTVFSVNAQIFKYKVYSNGVAWRKASGMMTYRPIGISMDNWPNEGS